MPFDIFEIIGTETLLVTVLEIQRDTYQRCQHRNHGIYFMRRSNEKRKQTGVRVLMLLARRERKEVAIQKISRWSIMAFQFMRTHAFFPAVQLSQLKIS